eukprot:3444779-Ditylum_brightwellii.AAC.1
MVSHATYQRTDTKRQQQGHIPWGEVSLNSNNQNTAFLDSGASGHYIQEDAQVTRSNKQDPAISVGQPR